MTSERYNARESEKYWQRPWDEKAIFVTKNSDLRPKYRGDLLIQHRYIRI